MRRLKMLLLVLLLPFYSLPALAVGAHAFSSKTAGLETPGQGDGGVLQAQDSGKDRQGDDQDDHDGDHEGDVDDDGEHDGDTGNDNDTDNDTDHDNENDQDNEHDDEHDDVEHDDQETGYRGGQSPGGAGKHERMRYDSSYTLFGLVRLINDGVVVGNRKLVGSNPWLAYLAPGMRLKVTGKVIDGKVEASRVVVLTPQSWSFYRGPAALLGRDGGWVDAWIEGSRAHVYRLSPSATEKGSPELLACYDSEGWRALPEGVTPNVTPPRAGWWLLEGTWRNGRLLGWRIERQLPGGGCGQGR